MKFPIALLGALALAAAGAQAQERHRRERAGPAEFRSPHWRCDDRFHHSHY
jgi:hypothetical protein